MKALDSLIREKVHPRTRGLSYRELDRQIGKEGQNWTSKFLKGPGARDFPGVPTLGTLLQLLRVLEVEPAVFFARVFPKGLVPAKPLAQKQEVTATLERLEERLKRLEEAQEGMGEQVARRRWNEDQRPAIDALEETVLRALRRVGIQAPEEEPKEPKKETEGRGR